jgi:transcriptional regulator with XRE-family HTH domain
VDNDLNNISFLSVRKLIGFKQDYFGLLFGMGKQAISRLERGKRKETLAHKEMLSFVTYLNEKDLLSDYIKWRFGLNINRHFYNSSTPMANTFEYNEPCRRNMKMEPDLQVDESIKP